MQNLIDYLKYSHLMVSLTLNPFDWFRAPVYCHIETESDMDPGMLLHVTAKFLFLKILVIIDDGRW